MCTCGRKMTPVTTKLVLSREAVRSAGIFKWRVGQSIINMKKPSPVVKRCELFSGGATGISIELYQRENGYCRLWAYYYDQDGLHSETLARFRELDWLTALSKAVKVKNERLKDALCGHKQ